MNTNTFLDNIPRVTKNLIIINVMVFLGTLLNQNAMTEMFALFYPTSRYFHWWQLVTHMFMHGGVWHIFFNMYSLFIFGSVIERMIGEKKFLIYYFACGFGAVALHLGVQYIQAAHYMSQMAAGSQSAMTLYKQLMMTPTLGASGAIMGLLIAYAMLFPPVTLTAKWWVIIFAAIELFTGVTGVASGIAHFAHLGGMLIGFILITYWRKNGTLFPRSW